MQYSLSQPKMGCLPFSSTHPVAQQKPWSWGSQQTHQGDTLVGQKLQSTPAPNCKEIQASKPQPTSGWSCAHTLWPIQNPLSWCNKACYDCSYKKGSRSWGSLEPTGWIPPQTSSTDRTPTNPGAPGISSLGGGGGTRRGARWLPGKGGEGQGIRKTLTLGEGRAKSNPNTHSKPTANWERVPVV